MTEEKEQTYDELMASLLTKSGTISYKSVAKSVTLRLPATDLATVDALCKVSESPRNKVLTILVRAGIDATMKHLDSDTRKRIADAQVVLLEELVQECHSGKVSLVDSEEK